VRSILVALIVVTMLAVLVVLLSGVARFALGTDPAKSNMLMRWRVILQAAALALLAILFSLARN
jgi:hypothetical protein